MTFRISNFLKALIILFLIFIFLFQNLGQITGEIEMNNDKNQNTFADFIPDEIEPYCDGSEHSQLIDMTLNNIKNIETICKKYFGNVIINYAEEPNFAKAVLWCFSQVKNDIFFHLEDDWVLNRKVKMSNILNFIKKNNINNWHQVVFQKKIPQQINEPTLIPSLHNTKHTKFFIKNMDNKTNPEAQMKFFYRKMKIKPFKYSI